MQENSRSARAKESTHQSKWVWKVFHVCGILCVIQKGSHVLRTGVSKVKAKNAHIPYSRYIKIQHHTLWYYPGKESGYLRPYIFEESNSVFDQKRLYSSSGIWNVRAQSTHVLNSKYIKAHTTLSYLPAKGRDPIFLWDMS